MPALTQWRPYQPRRWACCGTRGQALGGTHPTGTPPASANSALPGPPRNAPSFRPGPPWESQMPHPLTSNRRLIAVAPHLCFQHDRGIWAAPEYVTRSESRPHSLTELLNSASETRGSSHMCGPFWDPPLNALEQTPVSGRDPAIFKSSPGDCHEHCVSEAHIHHSEEASRNLGDSPCEIWKSLPGLLGASLLPEIGKHQIKTNVRCI